MTDLLAEKNRIAARMTACKTLQQLRWVWEGEQVPLAALRAGDKALWHHIVNLKDYLKPELMDDPAMQCPMPDEVAA